MNRTSTQTFKKRLLMKDLCKSLVNNLPEGYSIVKSDEADSFYFRPSSDHTPNRSLVTYIKGPDGKVHKVELSSEGRE
jgi:hypothetical protein